MPKKYYIAMSQKYFGIVQQYEPYLGSDVKLNTF